MNETHDERIRAALQATLPSPSQSLLNETQQHMADACNRQERPVYALYWVSGIVALLEIIVLLIVPRSVWTFTLALLRMLTGMPESMGYLVVFTACSWVVMLACIVPLAAWQQSKIQKGGIMV